jgi:hypothetical protein
MESVVQWAGQTATAPSEPFGFSAREAPEIHAKVFAGHLSANPAMIEGGFRTKTITVPGAGSSDSGTAEGPVLTPPRVSFHRSQASHGFISFNKRAHTRVREGACMIPGLRVA